MDHICAKENFKTQIIRSMHNQNTDTYDGKRSVIREHHPMNPSVIIMADPKAITHDTKLNVASKNRPRNVDSCFSNASRDSLENDSIQFIWKLGDN